MRPRCREVAVPSARIAVCVTVATLLSAAALGAQSERGIVPAVDSGAVANSWPKHAWVGAGLGTGIAPRDMVSGIITGWYSAGFVALGVRFAGVISHTDREDRALVVGARTRGNRWYLLGAAGIADITSPRPCKDCQPVFPPTTEFAYTLEGHGTGTFVGLGVTMFGALGPPEVRYTAIALTVNIGNFGQ